jgi:class III poly(R)-hydroxyalkanoic acid synthase PhaE subunit
LQLGKMWLDSVMEASRQGLPDLSQTLGPQSVDQVQELWRRQLARFAEAAATVPFGGSMANLFGGVQNVGDIARAVGSRLGSPWTDATRDLTVAWNSSLRGDPESFRQFVKTWKETYDKTYGRLLQAPTLGYSREPTERLMRSLDAYVDYLAAIQEFMTVLEKVGRGAAQRWVNRVSELAVDGGVPSHKAVYRLYMDTFEDNYYMVFRSREYSRLQAQVVDSGLRFKRRLDQALEDIIGQFPVATHSELNELYEAFYELRKQVKKQARRIRELEDKLASHAP